MAELSLAVTRGPGGFKKFVALKQIRPEAKDDERFVSLFLNEARISAALSHPGIAQVFDLGQEEGDYFIAMEFIEGQNLDEVRRAMATRAMVVPLGFTCAAMRDACLALHYAHHYVDPGGQPQPVVHRDITPANIMVTYEGNVKLVDFGLARDLDAEQPATKPKMVRGTVGYMSPEQMHAEPPQAQSDLYSAGVVLYELLTGTEFLRAPNDDARIERILNGAIPRPDEINPKIPVSLADVTLKAVSRDPDDRYQSGKEMAAAIESAAETLFDEDQMGAVIRSLFRRRMDITRALLAHAETGEHTPQLRADAEALYASEETSTADVEPPPLPQEGKAEPRARGVPGQGETVLIVDDEAAICELVKISLEKQGFRVAVCTDSSVAPVAVKAVAPDLIVMDVMMPRLNGFDLCRQIREAERSRHIPILFLSGACSLEERVKALEVGGDDFLRKPFSPVELAARVRTHIDRVRAIHRAIVTSGQTPRVGPFFRRIARWFSPAHE